MADGFDGFSASEEIAVESEVATDVSVPRSRACSVTTAGRTGRLRE